MFRAASTYRRRHDSILGARDGSMVSENLPASVAALPAATVLFAGALPFPLGTYFIAPVPARAGTEQKSLEI